MSSEIGQNIEKPDHIMSFMPPSGGSCNHYKEGAPIAVGGVHAERNIDKMETVEFEHLNLLLKAPSKDAVVRLCNEVFLYRKHVTLPQTLIDNATEILTSEVKDVTKMLAALRGLVKNALYSGSTEPSDVVGLFPGDFHKNLRDLLGKVIIENMGQWRESAVNGLVSLPRLVDFDWRVDVKTASDSSRVAVPSCVLQLQIQETATKTATAPGLCDFTVELSKETLDTMLDGLGKIRDQLSSVAKKT